MKKIILANEGAEVIKFLVRGQRNSNNALEIVIDSKGVLVQDADAVLVKERLGSNVDVVDVDVKKEAAKLAPVVDDAVEVARRAALTEEERAAEDEAKAKAEADAKAAKKAAKKVAPKKAVK